MGESDAAFMRKYGNELSGDKGTWIDKCVWHGKAHTWDKVRWVVKEVISIYQHPASRSHLDSIYFDQWHHISGGRPFLLKGIQTGTDAQAALEVGCAGVVVSNHAGRQVDGAIPSLDALEDVVNAVGGSA